jgi:hypothetical protein
LNISWQNRSGVVCKNLTALSRKWLEI